MNLGLSVSELVTELARKEKEIVFLLLVTTSLGQHPSRGQPAISFRLEKGSGDFDLMELNSRQSLQH